ncbi:PEP-CTERM sorting domain-containing protein [Cerasicoccus maritimus]|uniref:PEP-CTERM sorting domain-containing protein n=1 Tax=Cerasicoccus maritimus TaxID=490089 RepID=UPI0028525AE2|nr:PEP-CTERM sorting domain-containing protein [Cerasicoccus maritimus]
MKTKLPAFLLAGALASVATQVNAQSLNPSAGYSVGQALSSYTLGAYDIYDDGGAKAYGWDSTTSTLRNYDVANGGVLADYGAAPDSYADSAYISFVRQSPDGTSVWVGFSTYDGSDDRIYEVTNLDSTPTWNLKTTVSFNYDLEFDSSGNAFVIASNSIYYLDASNDYSAVLFASAGLYSADFSFDITGNLIYGTNGLDDNVLISFANGDITSFLADTSSWTALGVSDATLLSSLPAGAGGLYADEFGNIYVSTTDFGTYESLIMEWNGNTGDNENYDILASVYNSLGDLDGLGDLLEGGELYDSVGWNGSGIDTLGAVPEPQTYALIAGLASLAVIAIRRRRVSTRSF